MLASQSRRQCVNHARAVRRGFFTVGYFLTLSVRYSDAKAQHAAQIREEEQPIDEADVQTGAEQDAFNDTVPLAVVLLLILLVTEFSIISWKKTPHILSRRRQLRQELDDQADERVGDDETGVVIDSSDVESTFDEDAVTGSSGDDAENGGFGGDESDSTNPDDDEEELGGGVADSADGSYLGYSSSD